MTVETYFNPKIAMSYISRNACWSKISHSAPYVDVPFDPKFSKRKAQTHPTNNNNDSSTTHDDYTSRVSQQIRFWANKKNPTTECSEIQKIIEYYNNHSSPGQTSFVLKDIENIDWHKITQTDYMFINKFNSRYQKFKKLDFSYCLTSDLISMSNMFTGLVNLESISFTNCDLSHVRFARGVFINCLKLTRIENLAALKQCMPSTVKHMFKGCSYSNFKPLDDWTLSPLYDANAFPVEMAMMFNQSRATSIILDGWSSNATTVDGFISECPFVQKVVIKNFNFPFLECAYQAFANNPNLEELEIINSHFPNLSDVSRMIENCPKLKILRISGSKFPNIKLFDNILTGTSNISVFEYAGSDLEYVIEQNDSTKTNEVVSHLPASSVLLSQLKRIIEHDELKKLYESQQKMFKSIISQMSDSYNRLTLKHKRNANKRHRFVL